MARRLLLTAVMIFSLSLRNFRIGLILLTLGLAVVTPESALAQKRGRGVALKEVRVTESVIEEARSIVAAADDPEARQLLRTATDHQKTARRLMAAGRRGPAIEETLLARRLAARAMEQGGSGKSGRREDVEQLLRRSDQRIAAAEEWLRGRPDPDGGLSGDLATARRAMNRAREAFASGRREETLKHLATVRQILSAFPMSQGFDSREPKRLDREIEATDRLIDAMEQALPRASSARLDGAREAQRRARERLSRDQPAAALRLAAEARAHAVRIWDESGLPADRLVTGALIQGNGASIEDLDKVVARRSSAEAGRFLSQAREAHDRAVQSLARENVGAAWDSARSTLRFLWNARQSLVPDAPSRRNR